MKIRYESYTKPFAKQMRKELTKYEKKFWFEFAKNYQYKIYRQKLVDNYILDFYCAKAKVAIELDGSQHFEPINEEFDAQRTNNLNKYGILVLRYTNLELIKNFKYIYDEVDRIIRKRIALRTPQSVTT